MTRYAIHVYSIWGADLPPGKTYDEEAIRSILPKPKSKNDGDGNFPTTDPKVMSFRIHAEDENLPATVVADYKWTSFIEADDEEAAADAWWAGHDAYEWNYPSENNFVLWSSELIFADMIAMEAPSLDELVREVKKYALANYSANQGWDILVETFEDQDIIKWIDTAMTVEEAIATMGDCVGTIHDVWQDRMSYDAF